MQTEWECKEAQAVVTLSKKTVCHCLSMPEALSLQNRATSLAVESSAAAAAQSTRVAKAMQVGRTNPNLTSKSASKLQAGLLKSHRPFADKKRWRRHFSCEPLVYCCVLARKKLKPNLPRSQLFVLLQEPKAMTTIHIWDSIWIMAPFLRFWSWCPFFGIFHPSHCT